MRIGAVPAFCCRRATPRLSAPRSTRVLRAILACGRSISPRTVRVFSLVLPHGGTTCGPPPRSQAPRRGVAWLMARLRMCWQRERRTRRLRDAAPFLRLSRISALGDRLHHLLDHPRRQAWHSVPVGTAYRRVTWRLSGWTRLFALAEKAPACSTSCACSARLCSLGGCSPVVLGSACHASAVCQFGCLVPFCCVLATAKLRHGLPLQHARTHQLVVE